MRICILTRGDLYPTNHGAAVKIIRTAESLSRLGHPCCIVTDDRDHYFRYENGKRERVPWPARFRAAQEWPGLPWAGRMAERLCQQVGYPEEEHFLYRPMFDPAWWMRAVAVGVLEDIDVFQAEFPGYGVPAWMAAQVVGQDRPPDKRPRASIVQHNVEWDRLAEFGHEVKRIRAAEQWVLDRMDHVIAVSEDDKRRMVGGGLDADRISIIPHGVDVAQYAQASSDGVRERYGIDEDAPLLVFHGTLHYWPNTEAVRFIVEQLLPRLQATVPNIRVLCPGLNPPEYYAHDAVVTPGAVDDLEALIAAADVAICPLFAGGGTRLKLLEYMAAGKAIVSTTKGAEGIPYRAGEHMLISDDADSFAASIAVLLEDPSRRRALGAAAARFASGYDWSRIGASYVQLYGGALPEAQAKVSIDAHLPAARAQSKPLTMLLLINRGCNLRCSFCDLWDEPSNMDVPGKLIPLLDEAVAIGTKTLVITGGEPFIHPRLFDAVAAAKARGMSVNITTNGTLIDKRWDALVNSGVDSLSFSLDGMPPTHDRIRGKDGAWKQTVAGLERVSKETGIATSVYFVVTRDNVGELTQVYDLARSKGAKFDFWPVNDAEDQYLVSDADKAAWRQAVQHIAAVEPEVSDRVAYYEAALNYHAGDTGPVRCLGLVDQYGVTYEGSLLPCCVWGGDGLTVGNVFEQSLSTLWRSDAVQSHREHLYRDGCVAGCYNHSLYEFGVATGESFRVERECTG